MSGLKFDDFAPKVISSKTHSIIDYIHAGANFVAEHCSTSVATPARDMRLRHWAPAC